MTGYTAQRTIINITPTKMKNNPLYIVKQAKDWVAGLVSGITYEDKGGYTEADLPDGERQSNSKMESSGCVSWTVNDCPETQANKFAKQGAWSEQNLMEMEALGFQSNGRFNFSDRFLADASNTGRTGNTVQAVIDALRTYGMVGEAVWPFTQDMDWDTFYKEPPANIYSIAKKFFWYFDVQYEWVVLDGKPTGNFTSVAECLKYHTKHAPVLITTPLCPGWNSGLVATCSGYPLAHATMVYSVDEYINILDHYEPFKKKLALDYPIPWAMKIVLIPKNEYLHTELKLGDISEEVRKLQKFLNLSEDTCVAKTGAGSKGFETNFYGSKTADAVLRLQKKYGGFSMWELYWLAGKTCGKKTTALVNRLAKSIQ